MNFKKGDWVVFPGYNIFPVQLQRDGAWGYSTNTLSGGIFTELTIQELAQYGVSGEYHIQDPRMAPLPEYARWTSADGVRKATKADMRKIVNILKQSSDRQVAELKKFKKALEKFK